MSLLQGRVSGRAQAGPLAPCALPSGVRCFRASRPYSRSHPQQLQRSSDERSGFAVVRAEAPSDPSSSGRASTLDKSAGRMTYKPLSYSEMVDDAMESISAAIKDGIRRQEVEFPPLPTSIDGYKGASDMYIDSNTQLALAGARKLAAKGRKVHLVLPDGGEFNRTIKVFKNSLELAEGVTLGHLQEGNPPYFLAGLFGGIPKIDSTEAGERADTYIFINATCVELMNVREYIEKFTADQARDKVFVLWNLELDTLRGDLGLPAFPPKELQYNFLSTFRPVFYVRARDYSKSVPVPPFIVNYSGALFREYPGPWQVMLKQDGGEYACIAEDRARYNLGEVKEELTVAMGLATEEEGSVAQFLRRGVTQSTWFEDDYDKEQFHDWRL